MKVETPLLRRLGPVPFWRGEAKCLDSLERMYAKAMESARRALAKSKSESASVPPTGGDLV